MNVRIQSYIQWTQKSYLAFSTNWLFKPKWFKPSEHKL